MPFGIVYFGSNAFVNRISRREARFGEIFRPQAPSCGKLFACKQPSEPGTGHAQIYIITAPRAQLLRLYNEQMVVAGEWFTNRDAHSLPTR